MSRDEIVGSTVLPPGVIGEVRALVADRLAARGLTVSLGNHGHQRALAEAVVWDVLDGMARSASERGDAPLTAEAEHELCDRVLAELFGLGGFEALLADPTIEDVFVNGCDRVIVARSDGRREQVGPVAASDEALVELVNGWARRLGRTERRFDDACPRLDMRLPGGMRLHAIMGVSPRPSITIRCARLADVRLDDLVGLGTLDPLLAEVLATAVAARCNMIVAGGTGAGKTTLLRALLAEVPPDERVVTVEDTTELALGADPIAHPNVVELETRDANVEGVGAITMADLTRECLRMSPDRVVVGEVRGGEALAMLKAMGQGNDGSMCTLHAESTRGVHARLRGYCAEAASGLPTSAVDQFFRSAVHLVIHLRRLSDRRRIVTGLSEVVSDAHDGVRWNDLFVASGDDTARLHTAPSDELFARCAGVGAGTERWRAALVERGGRR